MLLTQTLRQNYNQSTMPRKKVIKEIPLNSDDDDDSTMAQESPAPNPTTTPTTATETQTAIPSTPPPAPAPTVPPPTPVKKKAIAIPQRAVTQKRLDSLKAANEARLRLKIEKELEDKRRREQEQDRAMEQKMKKMVEDLLKAKEKFAQPPPPQPVQKPSRFSRLPPPALQEYDDEEDVYYDAYETPRMFFFKNTVLIFSN